MKKFNGYEEIEIYDENKVTLVPGGYICICKGAKVIEGTKPHSDGNVYSSIKLALDIYEGDLKNYYTNRFADDKAKDPNALWKGSMFVNIPEDNYQSELNREYKKKFKLFINAIQLSNEGFIWNWQEKELIDRLFGGIFGYKSFQDQISGETRKYVQCKYAVSTTRIKSGNFKIPYFDESLIQNNNNTNGVSDFEAITNSEVVPF